MVASFVQSNKAITPTVLSNMKQSGPSQYTQQEITSDFNDNDDNDDGRTIYHHRLQNAKNSKAKVILSPPTNTTPGQTTSSFTSSILPGNRYNTFNTSSLIDIVASTLFIERIKQRNDEDNVTTNVTTNRSIDVNVSEKELKLSNHSRKEKEKAKQQKHDEKKVHSDDRYSSINQKRGILKNEQKQQLLQKPQARKAIIKKVKFAMNSDTFTVHIIPRYNSSESIDVWYGPMEYRHMEMQRKRTIAYLQNSYIYRYNINFNTFCFQGLEKHFTPNQLSYIKDQELDFNIKYEGMGTVPLSRDGRSRSSQRSSYELSSDAKLNLLSELIATERHRQQQRRTQHQKIHDQQKVIRSTELITKQNSRPFLGDQLGNESDKYTKYSPLDLTSPSGSTSPSRRSKSMSSPTKTLRIDKLLSLSNKNRNTTKSESQTSRPSSPRKTKSPSNNTAFSTGKKEKRNVHNGISEAVKTNSSDSDDPLSIAPPFTSSPSLSPQKHRPSISTSGSTSPTKKKLSLTRSSTPPSPSMLSRNGSKTLAPTTSFNKYDVKNDGNSTSRPMLKGNDSKYIDYYHSRKQQFLSYKR